MCTAWALPGVNPWASIAAVMSLVFGSQVNVADPVGVAVNVVMIGAPEAVLDGEAGVDDDGELEQAALANSRQAAAASGNPRTGRMWS